MLHGAQAYDSFGRGTGRILGWGGVGQGIEWGCFLNWSCAAPRCTFVKWVRQQAGRIWQERTRVAFGMRRRSGLVRHGTPTCMSVHSPFITSPRLGLPGWPMQQVPSPFPHTSAALSLSIPLLPLLRECLMVTFSSLRPFPPQELVASAGKKVDPNKVGGGGVRVCGAGAMKRGGWLGGCRAGFSWGANGWARTQGTGMYGKGRSCWVGTWGCSGVHPGLWSRGRGGFLYLHVCVVLCCNSTACPTRYLAHVGDRLMLLAVYQ